MKIFVKISIIYFNDHLSQFLQTKLLRTTQRLVGFSILQQAYSSQPPSSSSNPFVSLLVNVSSFSYCSGYWTVYKANCLKEIGLCYLNCEMSSVLYVY